MTNYETYVFILCLIVFVMLTALFTYLITVVTKQQLKMIRHGLEDIEIRREYRKSAPMSRVWSVISTVLSVLICLVLCALFVFSIYLRATEGRSANGTPALRVVMSDSMSYKAEKNTYLTEHGLDDQLQTFDLIVTRRLPEEKNLNLYDIVVYELDGDYIVHRIVAIEEPDEYHPKQRWFRLQGDALSGQDRLPVTYEQMRGIYEGERIPNVGSFIMFMQSPAGWLCILLIAFALITTPIVEKKLKQEKRRRMRLMSESLLLYEEEMKENTTEEGARHV